MSQQPLEKVIIILGTTAVGKTKLSIELTKELTKHFDQSQLQDNKKENDYLCEIISADSVQVYKGLEICSDAMTPDESEGVSHHLVGFLEPNEEYTVHNFVQCANNAIKQISNKNKIPIIAGGTFYYTESLIFKSFCNQNALQTKNYNNSNNSNNNNTKNTKNNNNSARDTANSTNIENSKENSECKSNNIDNIDNIDNISDSTNLWNKLNEIDPIMANFYHKNDIRRIQRSIDVYNETGILHSTHIKQTGGKFGMKMNLSSNDNNSNNNNMRYDCIILWLDANIETIDNRINSRLLLMEQSGIFEEIETFYQTLINKYNYDILDPNITNNSNNSKNNNTNNNEYICIAHGFGFQSFLPWLKAKFKDDIKDAKMIREIRQSCIDKYGLETRRYARKQRRWLKNRIAKSIINNENLKIIRFDTSNKKLWRDTVLQPASEIVVSFLENKLDNSNDNSLFNEKFSQTVEFITDNSGKSNGKGRTNRKYVDLTDNRGYFMCKVCDNQEFLGKVTFDAHLRSKRHKKKIQNMKRAELNHFKRMEKMKQEMDKDWKEVNTF